MIHSRPSSIQFSRTNDNAGFSRRTFLLGGSAMLALRASRLRAFALPESPASLSPLCLLSSRASYPPMLAKFIEKLDPAYDVFPTEEYSEEIQRQLTAWSVALCKSVHDLDVISRDLSEELRAFATSPSHTEQLRATGPLRV